MVMGVEGAEIVRVCGGVVVRDWELRARGNWEREEVRDFGERGGDVKGETRR